jgi:hypothetical protein
LPICRGASTIVQQVDNGIILSRYISPFFRVAENEPKPLKTGSRTQNCTPVEKSQAAPRKVHNCPALASSLEQA